jgi:hypothetical protein
MEAGDEDLRTQQEDILDHMIEVQREERRKRSWRRLLIIAVVGILFSLCALYVPAPPFLRIAFGVIGLLSIFVALFILSTKPGGSGLYNGPSFWSP